MESMTVKRLERYDFKGGFYEKKDAVVIFKAQAINQ
jgi:hypothetical protein